MIDEKLGGAAEKKFCHGCEKNRSIEDFRWRDKAKGTRNSRCFECKNKQGKAKYDADPEASKKYTSARYHRTKKLSAKTLVLKNAPEGKNWCGWHQDFHLNSEFYADKSTKNGLDTWCKEARNNARAQHYVDNRETLLERTCLWGKENREHHRISERKSYQKLKAESPETIRIKSAARASKLRHAMPKCMTDAYKKELNAIYESTLAVGLTNDHIFAIHAQDKDGVHVGCGLHVPCNLQPMTKEDNSRKGCLLDINNPIFSIEHLRKELGYDK